MDLACSILTRSQYYSNADCGAVLGVRTMQLRGAFSLWQVDQVNALEMGDAQEGRRGRSCRQGWNIGCYARATTYILPRMQVDQAMADEAVNMEEGEGFRQGSEISGEEDSQDNTQSVGRVKRPPRSAPGRSGSRVSALAATEALHTGSCVASDCSPHACHSFRDPLRNLASPHQEPL